MKYRIDKNITECPECEKVDNNGFIFNRALSKPRTEYKCVNCGQEWHYSKNGNAVDNCDNIIAYF